jgi:hypothetical protein
MQMEFSQVYLMIFMGMRTQVILYRVNTNDLYILKKIFRRSEICTIMKFVGHRK